MYNNVGKKIKMLAQVMLWLEIIASIVVAIICWVEAADNRSYSDWYTSLGFIHLIVGPLIYWIINMMLYGYGEIIVKVTEIESGVGGANTKSQEQHQKSSERIKRLERLYEQGFITEAEYQKSISKGSEM